MTVRASLIESVRSSSLAGQWLVRAAPNPFRLDRPVDDERAFEQILRRRDVFLGGDVPRVESGDPVRRLLDDGNERRRLVNARQSHAKDGADHKDQAEHQADRDQPFALPGHPQQRFRLPAFFRLGSATPQRRRDQHHGPLSRQDGWAGIECNWYADCAEREFLEDSPHLLILRVPKVNGGEEGSVNLRQRVFRAHAKAQRAQRNREDALSSLRPLRLCVRSLTRLDRNAGLGYRLGLNQLFRKTGGLP